MSIPTTIGGIVITDLQEAVQANNVSTSLIGLAAFSTASLCRMSEML